MLQDRDHLQAILDDMASDDSDRLPDLKAILAVGDVLAGEVESLPGVTPMNTVLADTAFPTPEKQKAIRSQAESMPPQALSSLNYVIRETGKPKGAMFDHARNLAALRYVAGWFDLDKDDVAFTPGPWSEAPNLVASLHYFLSGIVNVVIGAGDSAGESMQQTIDLAVDLNLDEAMFSLTTPFPGTRLWDELVRKRPGTEYNQDFTRAYYYGNPDEELAPFLNVSEVPDTVLGQWIHRAHRALAESKARRLYQRAFGLWLGSILWRVSRFEPLRVMARRLLRWGFFKRFASLRAGVTKTWS